MLAARGSKDRKPDGGAHSRPRKALRLIFLPKINIFGRLHVTNENESPRALEEKAAPSQPSESVG